MKKEARGMTAILLIYSLLMLLMLGMTVLVLTKRVRTLSANPTTDDEPKEKYVYIYEESEETDTAIVEKEERWIVKEHEKRIGIFSEDGILLELLEVYTNTLPKADQSLLREGITVTTRSDLYALIEDYSE